MGFPKFAGAFTGIALWACLAGCELLVTAEPTNIGAGTWTNTEHGVVLILDDDGTGSASPLHASHAEACYSPTTPSYSGPVKWSQSYIPGSLPLVTVSVYPNDEYGALIFSPGGKGADSWSSLLMFPCGDPDVTYPIVLTRTDGSPAAS